MRHHFNFHFLHEVDLFGKEAELYYKGKNKKSALIGRIFTILYVLIYLAFFVYKLVRMLQKVDVTFYQTTAYTGEPPYIHLTNENFYGGFALSNARTLQPFIDPTIYFIDLQFRTGERINNLWNWKIQRLELEICQLEKFNPKYWDLFREKPLSNMYCPKEMDVLLQGHTTYDVYSYFYVGFYPCVNTSTMTNCKPPEVIDQYLKNAYVSFKMQDIELTPQDYSSPVQLRGKEVNSPASKNLFQNINAYFQVVELETDNDIVGFEGLSNIKKEKFIKYDGPIVLSRLNDNIQYTAGQALCDVTVQLIEQVLTIKRTYPKLIEVLGDVGGLMEVFFVVFKVISSLITDILYEKSMVNNLFEFDLDKKMVLIRELRKNKKKGTKRILKEENNFKNGINIFSPDKQPEKFTHNLKNNEDFTVQTRNKLNEDYLKSNNILSKDSFIINNAKSRKKKKSKTKIRHNFSKNDNNELKIINIKKSETHLDKHNIFNLNEEKKSDSNDNNPNNENYEKNITERENDKSLNRSKTKGSEKSKRNIINKIKISKACVCLCFLCVKKRKNYQNILIKEGMNIITQYLDVLNIFKKLFRDGKIQEKLNEPKDDKVKMTDECIKKLQNSKFPFNKG